MLNPSTADANEDDPTIRRCIGFAKSWGYGGIMVANLFAYRATDPKQLLTVIDPVGEGNKSYITDVFDGCEKVICAWGNSPIVGKLIKGKNIFTDLSNKYDKQKIHILDISKTGHPKHPLYLKGDIVPIQCYPYKPDVIFPQGQRNT